MTKSLKQRLLVLGLTTLLALMVVAGWFWGPSYRQYSECGICGRSRDEYWRLGVPLKLRERETAISAWIGTTGVPEHSHIWKHVSSMGRRQWFGTVVAADGGALGCIYYAGRKELGEQRARQFFEEYRKVLVNDHKAAWKFITDYRLALYCLPAITNKLHSNPAFRDVHIEIQAEGRVRYSVSGTVATEEQKAELQNLVARSWVDAAYDLRVLSGLP